MRMVRISPFESVMVREALGAECVRAAQVLFVDLDAGGGYLRDVCVVFGI